MIAKQYRLGAVLSYVTLIIGVVSGLLYTPWMIRTIGQSDYGLYGLASSLIGMFLIDLGLGNAVTKFVAQFRAEKKADEINRLINLIVKLYFVISAILLLILTIVFFSMEYIYSSLTPVELSRFKIIFVICTAYMITNFFFTPLSGILNAYEKFIQLKVCDLSGQIFNIVLTVTALLLGWGVYALVCSHLISAIIIISIKLWFVFKDTDIKLQKSKFDKDLFKQVFSFSIWVTVISLAQRLVINISPSILATVAGTTAIALFNVGAVLEQYNFSITNSINSMFITKVSNVVYNNNDNSDGGNVLPIMIKVGRFQCIISGMIIVGFITVGKQFINCWMGADYADSFWIVLLMILPAFAYAPKQIGITAITVTNNIKYEAAVTVAIGLINLPLSYFLSKYYGAIGTALSVFIVYNIRNILIDIVLTKIININIKEFYKKTYFKTFLAQLTVMAISYCILKFIPDGGWTLFIIKAAIVTVIYIVLICVFALERDEKTMLSNVITKKIFKFRRG